MGVGDKWNKINHKLIIVEAEWYLCGGSLHYALYFWIFLTFSIIKSWKKKTQQQKMFKRRKGTLSSTVWFLLMAKLGTERLNDLFTTMLTPDRVFTPTESIKLTCVKSRMTVWTLSPGGINLCSSSGIVVLMTTGGNFISSSSSSVFVASSPSTSPSCVKN